MFSFPKIKFANTNTIDQQVQHIYSEVVEAMQDYNKGMTGDMDMELMDLYHSIETYFRIRQKQGIDIHATHAAVVKKNAERGYYG